MATTEQITTAEQLLQAPDLGHCELLRGEIVMMAPAGFEHGEIADLIAAALTVFVKPRGLGRVVVSESGFHIGHDPDTVRVPDVAFVRAERRPPGRIKGFFQGAPDLAVEVVSPTDRVSEVNAKVQEWLDAGCRMVWVVDPETRIVTVYQGRTQAVVLRASDTISGGDLLPGFSLPVAEIFGS
jgi:Uma2 family endonuclease